MPVTNLFKILWAVCAVFTLTISAHAQMESVATGEMKMVDAHGVCKKITNTGGPTFMVPFRLAAEWSSFRSGKPAHASLAGCSNCYSGADMIPHHRCTGGTLLGSSVVGGNNYPGCTSYCSTLNNVSCCVLDGVTCRAYRGASYPTSGTSSTRAIQCEGAAPPPTPFSCGPLVANYYCPSGSTVASTNGPTGFMNQAQCATWCESYPTANACTWQDAIFISTVYCSAAICSLEYSDFSGLVASGTCN